MENLINKTLVLLSGPQGSGKSAIAAEMIKCLRHAGEKPLLLKFADPLYEMHDLCRTVLRRYSVDLFPGVDGRLLQLLGTEWGRDSRGENIWVDIFRNRLKAAQSGIVICDDARFPNEMDAFKDVATVMKVRLTASEECRKARAAKWRTDTEHESETALNSYHDFDLRFNTEFINPTQAAITICRMIGVHLARYE
jgi:energy-coupling factor transporter ATP-binding protein EcfA2